MYKLILVLLVFFGTIGILLGQSPSIPENGQAQRIIDRWDIRYGSDIFTSNQNFRRIEAFKLVQKYINKQNLSQKEEEDLKYLIRDNNEWATTDFSLNINEEKVEGSDYFYRLTNEDSLNIIKKETRDPILKYFYKSPANLFEADENKFKIRINPVINFQLGKEIGTENFIFQNTRGLNVRAYIDDKIYVFTSILENQARFNDYHEARINKFRTIPGNGLYKGYNSKISDKINGWDFLNAQAYVGMQVSESVGIELGHGRHKLGNGIRSLLLSDWAHNYFYLKFNTQVWKFHFQNLFAELAPLSDAFNPGNTLLPKKYIANHYLAFKPSKNIEIGLFETVVFNRENHFELQYLNPVILYRTVEQFLDSPDNVLLGLNAKWNIANKMQFYGQLILDEFKLNEFTAGTGWWANKYGYQLGLKYINVGNIDHLDAQIEYNTVRPYTYSHRDTLASNSEFAQASYSHYNQPLAHPAGANFREILFNLSYQFNEKLFLRGRYMRNSMGDDGVGENWGGNILAPHGTREMDFGNELLQGQKTNVSQFGFEISYMIFHNYHLDFNYLYRKSESNLLSNNFNTQYFGGGIRVNLGRRDIDY